MKSLKKIALLLAIPMVLALLGIVTVGARTNDEEKVFNAVTEYKKCVACHGPKADKKFDVAKSDEEHIQIILKGKKAEKPPHMPAYESKGMTAEQAKAMLEHMKSLRQ